MDRKPAGRPFVQLRLVVLLVLLPAAMPQEFGDFQQMLDWTIGAKISSMLSSTCCVIRQQSCWTSTRQAMMPPDNTTFDLASDTKKFSQCLCANWRQCELRFPAGFLPSDANGLIFDFTFVTQAVMKRYSCVYRDVRDLVCQLRDSMQSGLMGWGLSGLGRGGLLGLGGMGLMGEEAAEELVEQMLKAGIPPRSAIHTCRRCAPLACSAELTTDPSRSRPYYRRGRDTENTQRSRFHSCLRRHDVAPPQQTTSVRPPSDNVTAAILPDVIVTPGSWQRTTTTLPARSTMPPPSTQSTTFQPPPPHAQPDTTVLPTTSATPRAAFTSATTTPMPATTLTLLSSTRTEPNTTWEEIVRYLFDLSKTTTPAGTRNPVKDGLSGRASAVRSPSATPRPILPPKDTSTELTNIGRAATEGGGNGVTVAVVGVTVAVSVLASLLLFFLLWRRRRRQREKKNGMESPAVTATHSATGLRASVRLSKTTSLPSVSSQRNVVEDNLDEDDEKTESDYVKNVEDEDSDTGSEERYTSEKTMIAALAAKPGHGSAATADGGEENETYASLDEAAMLATCRCLTSAPDVTSAAALSSVAHPVRIAEDSGIYLSMTGTSHKAADKGKMIADREVNYCNEQAVVNSGFGAIFHRSASGRSDDGYERLDVPRILNGKSCCKQKAAADAPGYLNLALDARNRAQMALPRPEEQRGKMSDPLSFAHGSESSSIYSEPYLWPAGPLRSEIKDNRMFVLTADGASTEGDTTATGADVDDDTSNARVAKNSDSEMSAEMPRSSLQKVSTGLPVSAINFDDGYLVPIASATSQRL